MALPHRSLRLCLAALFAGLVAATPTARALLNIDGTRNQLFVFGGATLGYNSNVFAQAGGDGDSTLMLDAGAELKRKAGIIGVDAIAKVDFVRYSSYSELNSVNPSLSLELSKTTGRTTGNFSLQAYRETRSDSAVNLHTASWNFPVALNLRYPINEKFYLTSGTAYLKRNYQDNNALVNYTDLSEGVDLYYTYTSKLDLLAGYRIRFSRDAVYGHAVDNWFSVGATGGLFAKLTGTVRAGYQLRTVELGTPDHFNHFNFAAALNWPVLRKLTLSLAANRDFGTIATGQSVDSSSLSLRATYAYNRKLEFSSGVTVGVNNFLGDVQNDRRDTYFSWDVSAQYKLNEHFQMGASYTYFQNWSTLALGDYDSQGISLNLSGRY